jgi:hypothetical protein
MKNDPDCIVHRAAYTLECGTWRACCRICGYEVTDPDRRKAASQFRLHIQSTSSIIDHPGSRLEQQAGPIPEPSPILAT